LAHDNQGVREFLNVYSSLSDFMDGHPAMGDVLTAASCAKSPGDTARKPLSIARIFALLGACDVISTQATSRLFAWANYSEAAIKRYTQAARTASMFFAMELDKAAK